MKVYQRSDKPNKIGFTNYDCIDEEIIFQNAMEILKNNKNVVIGEKSIGP